MLVSNGLGTYLGLTLVFLKSKPTIEVPLGITTPPLILLNLYKILSSCSISKLEVKLNEKVSCAFVSPPDGETALAAVGFPASGLIANPGRLSIVCSPG